MRRLAIIGAGDLGLQLHHLADLLRFEIAGFFDDTRTPGTEVAGSVVLGGLSDIRPAFDRDQFDSLVVGIGYKHLDLRQSLYRLHEGHIPFATLVHPSAVVDATCRIGAGSVLYSGCVLDMEARIGSNCLLNTGCVIAHHSNIGDGCFLSPAVSIAGFVVVEPGCVLGIGTIVIDNIRIASGCRTGAGAVVTRHIEERGLYLGIPAQLAKTSP